MSPFNLLWLKRDLRWQDNDALQAAFADGKKLFALFCFEPLVQEHPDTSARHLKMQRQALQGMLSELGAFTNHLIILEANADDVIDFLIDKFPIAGIFAHKEHGVAATYERDKRIKKSCKKAQVSWHEFDHNGVQRGRQDRSHWDEDWRTYMQKPLSAVKLEEWPLLLEDEIEPIQKALKVQFKPLSLTPSQSAESHLNRFNSKARMKAFLDASAQGYQKHIGEPQYAIQHCSRLSVALAWGTLSLREVYQASIEAHQQASRKSDLRAFISRIHWHSHFIQKFEMEMRMEFENLNSGFDRLRQNGQVEYLKRWAEGSTGIPLVDACMRAVKATGYLNFRMRAMVMSFWSHILWQPWQMAVHHLAQCFSDYIPGIHYPQVQMQSSVTGINTIRVYNPIKQSLEKDPQAEFISKWIPELAELPVPFRHEPWKLSPLEQQFYGFRIGEDYPEPIVDIAKATNFAREQLWQMKQDPLVRVENQRILQKHTAANRNISRRTQIIMNQKASQQ